MFGAHGELDKVVRENINNNSVQNARTLSFDRTHVARRVFGETAYAFFATSFRLDYLETKPTPRAV